MLPDSELVRCVQRGQTSAYEQLVRRYERAAKIVALHIVKDHHRAEDVVQDSFVIAFQRLNSLRNGSKFGPWLMQITRREAGRERREHRVIRSIDSTAEPSNLVDTGHLGDSEMDLVELIGRLPAHERLVVTLHYLDDLSVNEIADFTRRPVGTVTKQLSRAMQRLRGWTTKREPTS